MEPEELRGSPRKPENIAKSTTKTEMPKTTAKSTKTTEMPDKTRQAARQAKKIYLEHYESNNCVAAYDRCRGNLCKLIKLQATNAEATSASHNAAGTLSWGTTASYTAAGEKPPWPH